METTETTALRISVVICAHFDERWDDLAASVASVRAQTAPPAELLVVVDTNPRLLARARAAFPADVAVLPNGAARGLSGARNSGVAAATGDVVAFLDDDAEAAPDWLAHLAARYADPRVVGVGGAVVPRWLAPRPPWFPPEFDWVVGCHHPDVPTGDAPVRNFIGANMSFRRDTLRAVGGFRDEFGRTGTRLLTAEETELCIRVRQRWPGAVLLHAPGATVRHRVPPSRLRPSYFRARCFAEGRGKARLVHLLGAGDGLAVERTYVRDTLRRGVVRGAADAVLRRDGAGAARAGAIAAGLAITAAGYGYGLLTERYTQARTERAQRAQMRRGRDVVQRV